MPTPPDAGAAVVPKRERGGGGGGDISVTATGAPVRRKRARRGSDGEYSVYARSSEATAMMTETRTTRE